MRRVIAMRMPVLFHPSCNRRRRDYATLSAKAISSGAIDEVALGELGVRVAAGTMSKEEAADTLKLAIEEREARTISSARTPPRIESSELGR